MPTTHRPTPICHRTLHPGYGWHDPQGHLHWCRTNENSGPCAGSRCALHVLVRSVTDPKVVLMRCADNPDAEPWLDPAVSQPTLEEPR